MKKKIKIKKAKVLKAKDKVKKTSCGGEDYFLP